MNDKEIQKNMKISQWHERRNINETDSLIQL